MEIKYNLSPYTKEDAYHLVDTFLDGLVNKYSDMISNPNKTWNSNKDKMDFGFTVSRKNKQYDLEGNIKINEKELIVQSDLPFPVNLASGKIKDMINEKLDELFVK